MEKPISPANLVKTICDILKVDPEAAEEADTEFGSERGKITKLIQKTDSDTLKKIREVLNQK